MLSIIIPAYNEGRIIGKVIDRIKKVPVNAEIIVVDDGSQDDTEKKAIEKGAKVIKHVVNQGKGISIRDGIASANAEVVLFIDGDGQDDPADIPKLLQAITQGADFVIGSRWIGVLQEGAISKINFFVTDFITRFINLLFDANITDSQAGFRCIRKSKIKRFNLTAKGYEIETEMLIKAIKNKLRIVEVPVVRSKRTYGKTNMKRFRLGVTLFFLMLRELSTYS
jgi:glycosyltransferase involved in cell wall biosynthesis